MDRRLAFLHTAFVLVEPVRRLMQQLSPEIPTFHVVDESLLQDMLRTGGVTPDVVRRIGRLAVNAEEAGASTVVLTCSSASPSVSPVSAALRVPFLSIDEAMAEQAAARATRIGVLATVPTTIAPTRELLSAKARLGGRQLDIVSEVCAEAFQALLRGDRAEHDALVARASRDLAQKVELIVFAQGSMAPLAERLQPDLPVPILASLESGVRRAAEVWRRSPGSEPSPRGTGSRDQ